MINTNLILSHTVFELLQVISQISSFDGVHTRSRWTPKLRTSGVAKICCEEGQSWKLGHGALTDFRAGCSSWSMTNSFVTDAVLIERAVSCWHLHQLISQTTQYLDSWLSDWLQSELKMKLLEVDGARAPVPHSWRRHCSGPWNLASRN